ncbi:filamentous hemagglutinin outer membrane protein [Scytonema sp. HK-05]|uniref:two-partner secretion domain-containing protein n=1 Tax=Scytonema sp. HK-05 TaxID=1137095 RepID=UPI0009377663|nr:filamentous hemagglutinin N-terminal domain-containing protein [Scytonema sp. HK-05]OKH47348.1 hypothetical protein NIES2130_36000 [Scytonema sp. HK-05]BAY44468.1 filamentous hemagglutinin outer membrane protein [Scytonema sp. HK-05]
MSGIRTRWGWFLVIAMGGVFPFFGNCANAQITPDSTLPTNSNVTQVGNTSVINAGTQAGGNLFHSFKEFSVPTGGTAFFNNAVDIQNIISRVTGGSVSNIDGLIKANGTANLFLINPNGIVFGQNARLDVRGSFVGSTASSLKFADGFEFSATASQTTPLLTVSVPMGLQYGVNPGSILNRSLVTNTSDETIGLQVQPGKTLALVGGDVRLNSGSLTAPGGRVELGGLSGAGTVGLEGNGSNLSLSFPEGVARADVSITNEGAAILSPRNGVNVTGNDGGSIWVNARNIEITSSQLVAGIAENSTSPNAQAGDITLNATEMITIQSGSIENNQHGVTGSPGNILIRANGSLSIADSFISNILFKGTGKPGDISLQANDFISLTDDSSILTLNYFGDRDTGSVSVQSNNSVYLADDSSISTTTFGKGSSGDITVQTNALHLLDKAILNATTRGEGNGGNITVNVNNLEITGGGQIATTALKNGNAGNITVNAKDSITLSGSDLNRLFYLEFDPNTNSFIQSQPIRDEDELNSFGIVSLNSGLFANTTKSSSGQAGSIKIETSSLNIQDNAEVTISSVGLGDAGILTVNANLINLDKGKLVGTTALGRGGDISLQVKNLLLMRRGSQITTTAGTAKQPGDGGNITINTPNGFIVAAPKENNDITANAFSGSGGKITIRATNIFGIAPLSRQELERLSPNNLDPSKLQTNDITAISQTNPSLSGTVQLIIPDVDVNRGLVELPVNIVDISQQIDTGCNPGSRQRASSFVITGRGGLPPNPSDMLTPDAVLVDLITLNPNIDNRKSPSVTTKPTTNAPERIVEATGWVINEKGEVILTADASTTAPHESWQNPASCRAS